MTNKTKKWIFYGLSLLYLIRFMWIKIETIYGNIQYWKNDLPLGVSGIFKRFLALSYPQGIFNYLILIVMLFFIGLVFRMNQE